MDKHIANAPNNPINCKEELNLCSSCGTEKQKDSEGMITAFGVRNVYGVKNT